MDVLRVCFPRFNRIRHGVLFGDDGLELQGSLRRYSLLDDIQFGYAEGTAAVEIGLVAQSQFFNRAAKAIIRTYKNGGG